ncbi:MAG: biliverdin-producing heme oxygenase [Solirubrobacteraceae bacterium]|nr:biliverdin-producing heme oxygenase [Solirubrobacteraceae bacterium]
MSAVIMALRSATQDAHGALDASLDPEALLATREGYARFLAALYGFHVAVEEELGELTLPGLADAPARTSLLAADLTVLGADPEAIPVMEHLAAVTDDGARHGLLYVVEGSALGGTVLGRIVQRTLGYGPDHGAAFFGAGAATPGRWRQVKDLLEREAGGPRLAPAQRAAADAFAALARWMQTSGVARTDAVAE